MGSKEVNERIHGLSRRYRTLCSAALLVSVGVVLCVAIAGAVVAAGYVDGLLVSLLAGIIGFAGTALVANVVCALSVSVLAAICWRLDGRPEHADLGESEESEEFSEDPEQTEYKYNP